MSEQKPLFIPLKSEYFEAFRTGEKESELRRYGPRWNEKTCEMGRAVILSKGYGKGARLNATVTDFEKRRGADFGGLGRIAIMACYGTLDVEIAIISLTIDRKAEATTK